MSRTKVISPALLFVLLSAQAPVAAGPFDGISNVTVRQYDVAGRNVQAIRRSIDAARPTDRNDGKRVDGLSEWNMTWRWQQDARGNCRTTLADIGFTAVVTVPRLSDPTVPSRVRAQFDRYLATLLAHEAAHVRSAWDRRVEVADAMNAAGCTGIGQAAQTALRRIVALNVAFDKATNHGATTILPFG